MMRIRFWRTEPVTDALDPEVLSVFARSAHPPQLDAARLANSRARIGAMLRPEPVAQRSFRQRLAYGFVGGGGLWSSVVGIAAANKAATAVTVAALLAGGATTAEVTGVGPAIREAVSPAHSSSDGPAAVANTQSPTAEASQAVVTGTETPGAQVTPAPEGVPGNFVTQVNPNGDFTLRGQLVAVSGDHVDVQTSVDDVPLSFDVANTAIQLPGKPGETTLEDYEGQLVRLAGVCDTVDDQLTEDCTVETLTVLGNAGQAAPPETPPGNSGQNPEQGGPPESVGPPDDAGPPEQSNAPEDAGPPEDVGRPEDAGPPEDPGASGDQGRPDDVPRND